MTTQRAERLVLDASAALAILRDEPASAPVRQRLAAAEVRRILVPDVFWIEVANVLLRRYGHPAQDIAEAIRELDELGLETVAIDRPLLLLAVEWSAAGLTVYDATYLALAEATEAVLVTLDTALATAAGDRDALGTSGPSGRVTEASVDYRADRSIATLAGFGAYLARLRAEASTVTPR